MRAGNETVLNCEVDAHPEPVVAWSKDGQPVGASPAGQTLHIPTAQVRAQAGAGGSHLAPTGPQFPTQVTAHLCT